VADDETPQSLCANPQPLYAITDHLSQWGMLDWLIVVTHWLSRYHGIEALLSGRDQNPAQQILALLNSLPARPDDREFAQRLSHLDFLLWRIARADVDAKRWNPFEDTLCEYIDADSPIVWQWDDEYPAAAETEAWLLTELAKVRAAHSTIG
jgi:hypothetical protein